MRAPRSESGALSKMSETLAWMLPLRSKETFLLYETVRTPELLAPDLLEQVL